MNLPTVRLVRSHKQVSDCQKEVVTAKGHVAEKEKKLPNDFLIVATPGAAAWLSWAGSTLFALSPEKRWGGAPGSVSQLV